MLPRTGHCVSKLSGSQVITTSALLTLPFSSPARAPGGTQLGRQPWLQLQQLPPLWSAHSRRGMITQAAAAAASDSSAGKKITQNQFTEKAWQVGFPSPSPNPIGTVVLCPPC